MSATSEKNLVKRLNNKLSRERLRLCRFDSRYFGELGRCYSVDKNNYVVSKNVDLDDWAKELGVI
jgi:hypothetical protein